MKTRIVYEDSDIIVINKPAGLATQTAKVGQADVVSELKNYLAGENRKEPPFLGIIHRLDQPVEGLLVFAKNKKAAAKLSGQMNKQYYAVFCGKPCSREAELVDYLIKTPDNRAEVADIDTKDARKAVLRYKLIRTIQKSGEEISLVDVEIDTGRFHQIRVQMSHAGMPLLGDMKYSDERAKSCSLKLEVKTVALCAYRLAFIHPVTGKQMEFTIKPSGMAFEDFKL